MKFDLKSKKYEKAEVTEGESAKGKAAEKKVGMAKMEMLESKMHGKNRGSKKTNYKGKVC